MKLVLNRNRMSDNFFIYYPFPLSTDEYHYIWTASNMMAFEFINIDDPDNMHKIVDIINGVSDKSLPNIEIEFPFIKCNGYKILEVRGKGLLSIKYNLDDDNILLIQKKLVDYCAERLGKK